MRLIQPDKSFSAYEEEIIEHAKNSFGFLVETEIPISFKNFASRIKICYDCIGNPQNAEVIRVLENA